VFAVLQKFTAPFLFGAYVLMTAACLIFEIDGTSGMLRRRMISSSRSLRTVTSDQ
jgi:hypothetical protein